MLSSAPKPGTVAYRILLILKAEPLKLWSAQELATVLREKKGTVTKELSRLRKKVNYDGDPLLTYDPFRQSYRHFVKGETMPEIERVEVTIHALQMRIGVPQPHGWSPPAAARHVKWTENEKAVQYNGRFEYRGRKGTIQFQVTTGSLMVDLNANEHGMELRVPEAMEYLGFLEGLLKGQGFRYAEEYAEIVNVEFNQDFERLALSGMKRSMLRKWVNSWAQVYEKQTGVLRREFRLHPEDRTLTTLEALAILREMQRPPRALNLDHDAEAEHGLLPAWRHDADESVGSEVA